jgi:ABC-type transport system involved in multi-copper enzyme maturation permease subunit
MRAANPVLQRELLERWRGRRATTALTLFLSVLAIALYGLYRLGVTLVRGGGNAIAPIGMAGPTLGRFLLESLLFLTLVLVLFVVPAYAAAQIVGERERRTLPLLQATLLRPWEIAAGKLTAATAWMALLVISVAPLAAATMFLGGVTVADVLRGVASILITMIGIGGVALGISALTRRTTTAVVLTYAVVLALVGGTGAAALTSAIIAGSGDTGLQRPPVALYGNPFYGLADAANAAIAPGAADILPSPLSIIAFALPESEVFRGSQFPQDGGVLFEEQVGAADAGPTWLIVGALYLALGAVGFGAATWRLRDAAVRPSRRTRHAERRSASADHATGSEQEAPT